MQRVAEDQMTDVSDYEADCSEWETESGYMEEAAMVRN